MFNIDEIIPYFDRVNRKHYLGELLWKASTPTMTELALTLKRFWLSHFKWIIGTLIALGGLILMILNYCAKKIP